MPPTRQSRLSFEERSSIRLFDIWELPQNISAMHCANNPMSGPRVPSGPCRVRESRSMFCGAFRKNDSPANGFKVWADMA